MTLDQAVGILRHGLITGALISGPLLIGSLIVGLLVSIFQAVTQIHEMTITFIPKLVIVMLLFAFLMPWFSAIFVQFTKQLFLSIPSLVR